MKYRVTIDVSLEKLSQKTTGVEKMVDQVNDLINEILSNRTLKEEYKKRFKED